MLNQAGAAETKTSYDTVNVELADGRELRIKEENVERII
jgi:hypothetical protein